MREGSEKVDGSKISVSGLDDRPDVSSTFIQPFVAYTTKDAWTFSLNTESTYSPG